MAATTARPGDHHAPGRWGAWAMWPLAAAGALCGVHVVNLILLDRQALSLDQEGSAATIAAAGLFAIAGLLALREATSARRYRTGWAGLGLLGVLFALEEGGLMLHERFEDATSTGVGLILAVVFALALLGLLIASGPARFPMRARRIVLLAAGTLVLSQLLGGAATRAGQGTIRDVLAIGEECGELLVAALMAAAVLSALADRGSSQLPSGRG